MRRCPAIAATLLAVGALSGVAAYERAGSNPADWQEIAWPFPRDGWPAGRAFRCGSDGCRSLELYVRPKLGFCNCDSGVADDDEVDRVSDLDLISERFTPLRPGEAVRMADMQGRARAYQLQMAGNTRHTAVGIALSRRCDLVVAVVRGPGASDDMQRSAAALLETNEIRQWLQSAMQAR